MNSNQCKGSIPDLAALCTCTESLPQVIVTPTVISYKCFHIATQNVYREPFAQLYRNSSGTLDDFPQLCLTKGRSTRHADLISITQIRMPKESNLDISIANTPALLFLYTYSDLFRPAKDPSSGKDRMKAPG